MRTFIRISLAFLLAVVSATPAISAQPSATQFLHESYIFMVTGKRITLKALIIDPAGVKVARCYFRVTDDGDYLSVPMQRVEDSQYMYSATIPALGRDAQSIRYRFLAVNLLGQTTKTNEFVTAVSDTTVLPGWQKRQGQEKITILLETDQGSQTLKAFSDTIETEVVPPSSRHMVASEPTPPAKMAALASPSPPIGTAPVISDAAPSSVALPSPGATPSASTEPVTPRFTIKQFKVEGNTILAAAYVSALLKQFTGDRRDFADVQIALEALEEAYRSRGYSSVTVNLPEQDMKDGVITFNVVEARIKKITVEGNTHLTTANIVKSFPSLIIGNSPLVHDVSKNLRAVNENPAKKVSLQLQNGDKENEINALLKVADEKPWKIGLTFDNTGNSSTGDYRIGLLAQHFNLHNKDHVASFQYTTSPDHFDKVNSFSASYRVPVYRLGDTIDLFAGYSDVDSGSMNITTNDFSYTASNINGKGIITGARYNHTLKRYGEYSQKLVAGIDYRLYDNSSNVAISLSNGSSSSNQNATKLVLHPLSLTYNGSYTLEGGEAGAYLGGIYNIPWGEHGDRKDFPEGSKPDYFLLRYGANLGYMLPKDCQMRLTFNGQYSNDPLVAYEQMGLGGPTSGRGYDERAGAGDNGVGWSTEIYSPDLAPLARLPHTQLRLVGFYDDGYVYRSQNTNGSDGGTRLASLGSGVRIAVSKYVNISADWGFTLNKTSNTQAGDSKVHFKAALVY